MGTKAQMLATQTDSVHAVVESAQSSSTLQQSAPSATVQEPPAQTPSPHESAGPAQSPRDEQQPSTSKLVQVDPTQDASEQPPAGEQVLASAQQPVTVTVLHCDCMQAALAQAIPGSGQSERRVQQPGFWLRTQVPAIQADVRHGVAV
jgi:hypothetical protein